MVRPARRGQWLPTPERRAIVEPGLRGAATSIARLGRWLYRPDRKVWAETGAANDETGLPATSMAHRQQCGSFGRFRVRGMSAASTAGPPIRHAGFVMPRTSAGLLLYRRSAQGGIELLLAHPGGPLWATRDEGAWSLPKGEHDGDEGSADAARREFAEETGHEAPPGPLLDLGEIRLRSGKLVHGWAVEGALDPAQATSMTFEMEWPPRSGRMQSFPEIDRVHWFGPEQARRKLIAGQVPFIDALERALAGQPA